MYPLERRSEWRHLLHRWDCLFYLPVRPKDTRCPLGWYSIPLVLFSSGPNSSEWQINFSTEDLGESLLKILELLKLKSVNL